MDFEHTNPALFEHLSINIRHQGFQGEGDEQHCTQCETSQRCKRQKPQLSEDTLVGRKDALHLARHKICLFSLPDVLRSIHLEFANASDVPVDTQIDLFTFPIFDE